jgi:hypothetical protein
MATTMTSADVLWLSLWIFTSTGIVAICGAVGMAWFTGNILSERVSAVLIWLLMWFLVFGGTWFSVYGHVSGIHVVADAGMLAVLLGIAGIAGIVISGTYLQSKR